MRQIDWSEPLTPQDREWALANNYESKVRENDLEHGGESDVPEAPGAQVPLITGNEPSLGADRATPTGLTPDQFGADLDRGRRMAQLDAALSAESSDDETEAAGIERETPDNSYEDWKLPKLQDQAGRRELSKSGNKGEVIARLRTDDEESAASGEPDEGPDDVS